MISCFFLTQVDKLLNAPHIVFQLFLRLKSNYCNRDPFMHYKNRANVYKALGRGVFGSCCCCPLLFVFGGVGVFHTLVTLLWLHSSSVLVLTRVKFGFRRYTGLLDRRRVRGGLPSLCSASSFLPYKCVGRRKLWDNFEKEVSVKVLWVVSLIVHGGR